MTAQTAAVPCPPMGTPFPPCRPGGGDDDGGERTWAGFRGSLGAFSRSPVLTIALLAWFAIQASFLALVTGVGIPPDEIFHIDAIRFYAEHGLSPLVSSQQDFFHLGDLVRTPSYLYHYLLSFPYRLSPLGHGATVTALRLVNVAMVVGALWFLVLFMRHLLFPGAVVNLSLLVLTNTMMFVFLAGAVSYDNQVILLSSIAFFLFVRLVDRLSIRDLILFLATLLALMLTKVAALPLVILLFVTLAVLRRGAVRELPSQIREGWERSRLVLVGLLLLLAVPLTLVGERYGGNVVGYGSITVSCTEVHALEDCERNAVFRRNREIGAAAPPIEQRTPLASFSLQWLDRMRVTIFGIMGHRSTAPPALVQLGSIGLLGILVLGITRGLTRNRSLNASLLVGLVYVGVLLAVNRRTYMSSGLFGLALQGRYSFPVILPLVSGGLYYAWRATRDSLPVRRAVASFLVVTFVAAGVPAFLYATDPGWYGGRLSPVATALHEALRTLVPRLPHL